MNLFSVLFSLILFFAKDWLHVLYYNHSSLLYMHVQYMYMYLTVTKM